MSVTRPDDLTLATEVDRLADEQRIRVLEHEIDDGDDRARSEWKRDSAFRFFPLQEHEELGLTLHPFDLAPNKVLALVARLDAGLGRRHRQR